MATGPVRGKSWGGPHGRLGRHQELLKAILTREAGKDHLDSLGGTREAPGRFEDTPSKEKL